MYGCDYDAWAIKYETETFRAIPFTFSAKMSSVTVMIDAEGSTQHRSPPMFTDRHQTMVDLSQPRCVRTCMEHK